MRLEIPALIIWIGIASSSVVDRQLLSYAPIPADAYTPSVGSDTLTLLGLVQSRPELSNLASIVEQAEGFAQAFDTPTNWQFTFFAPSNAAFENTGYYFDTFTTTPKGKWWLGNLLQHHYVPNTAMMSQLFNSTALRFQTGSFLYVGARVEQDRVRLNNASTITEADIIVTNGVVHIIDHILDPAAQIFEIDLPKVSQSFLAGSCSDTTLPYC
ncbi:putative FAS1 domain-containing protein [Seiridium cardinale]|uniref:FAS1 domain-containing protein n=1 Tax=Seiridium cardinale TaxID=138064 RepID=A0ABR2Y287_9PEZI